MINDATVADAILDRLVHNAYRLDLKASPSAQPGPASTLTLNLLRIHCSGRPFGGRPQVRPPPNGTQAHDMSRELGMRTQLMRETLSSGSSERTCGERKVPEHTSFSHKA